MLAFRLCKVTCCCALCSKSDIFKSAGKGIQSMPHPVSDPICCCCCCSEVTHVCGGSDMVYPVFLQELQKKAAGHTHWHFHWACGMQLISHKVSMSVLATTSYAAEPCVRLQTVAIMLVAVHFGLHLATFCHNTIAGLYIITHYLMMSVCCS